MEMAGWSVEHAQERNREEASEFEGNFRPPTRWYPSRYGSLTTSKCLRQLHVMRERGGEAELVSHHMAFADSYRAGW